MLLQKWHSQTCSMQGYRKPLICKKKKKEKKEKNVVSAKCNKEEYNNIRYAYTHFRASFIRYLEPTSNMKTIVYSYSEEV